MILSLLKDDEAVSGPEQTGAFSFCRWKISGMNSSEGLSGNIITCLYQDRNAQFGQEPARRLNALHRRSVSMITEDEGLSDHSMGPVCKGPEEVFCRNCKRSRKHDLFIRSH